MTPAVGVFSLDCSLPLAPSVSSSNIACYICWNWSCPSSKSCPQPCWLNMGALAMCEHLCGVAEYQPCGEDKHTPMTGRCLPHVAWWFAYVLEHQAPMFSCFILHQSEYLTPYLCSTHRHGALYPSAWPRAGSDWVANSHPIAPRLPCPWYKPLSQTVFLLEFMC